MNNILSEKEYQRYIIDQLVKPECGYVEAPAAEFDRLHQSAGNESERQSS